MKLAKPIKQKLSDFIESSEKRSSIIMVLPATIFLFVFFGYPLIRLLWDSLFSLEILDPNAEFIGIQNYIEILKSPLVHKVLKNSVLYVIIAVSIEFLLGLGFALLLNIEFKGHQISRTLLLSPLMLAPLVSSLIWRFMLSDQFGLFNWMLYSLGFIKNPHSIKWLSTSGLSLLSTVIADIWLTTPFMMLILLAGLQSISPTLYESAEIDGANNLEKFWYITLPMLKPVATTAILLRTIDAARQFAITWNLTKGGPSSSSEVMSTQIYKILNKYGNIGEASAMSVLFTVILFIIGLFVIKKVWNPSKEE